MGLAGQTTIRDEAYCTNAFARNYHQLLNDLDILWSSWFKQVVNSEWPKYLHRIQ